MGENQENWVILWNGLNNNHIKYHLQQDKKKKKILGGGGKENQLSEVTRKSTVNKDKVAMQI